MESSEGNVFLYLMQKDPLYIDLMRKKKKTLIIQVKAHVQGSV